MNQFGLPGISKEAILKARETFFQTTTGKALLDSIYLS